RIKGVSDNFLEQGRFSKGYLTGELSLGTERQPAAIVGRGIGYFLTVELGNDFDFLQVFYPKAARAGSIDPRNMNNRDVINPVAYFNIDKQFEDEYIIVTHRFVENLLNYGKKKTALEIKVAEGYNSAKV